MKKRNIFLATLACTCLFANADKSFAASALSVPVEARGTADVAKAAAEEIRQSKANVKYRAEAEYYATSSEKEAERAEGETAMAYNRMVEAKEALERATKAKDTATPGSQFDAAMLNYQTARQRVLDTELVYNQNVEYTAKARDYATRTKAELDRVDAYIKNPGSSHYMGTGAKLYSWNAEDGIKGHQLIMPISVGYWSKNLSYSLYTNYVSSKSKSTGEEGSYTGFSDTYFFITKRQDQGKFYFDYSLGINIPTGKSEMSWGQRYARFNEDLVPVEQFGKSWQFTPGLSISVKPYKRDTWTLATYYIYSRSYDPTSDVLGDTLDPGGEWSNFLRYQHAGRRWQVVAKVLSTTHGRSKLSNGSSYRAKNEWEYQLTVNRKLSHDQDLMFYYWPERQNRSDLPFSSSSSFAHYFGTMWSKKLNPKSKLRVSLDVLQTNGARYTGIYNLFDFFNNPAYTARDVSGRKKVTFGLGYDHQINNNSSMNFDIQYFTMHDGKSNRGEPARHYNGLNIFFMYFRNL